MFLLRSGLWSEADAGNPGAVGCAQVSGLESAPRMESSPLAPLHGSPDQPDSMQAHLV